MPQLHGHNTLTIDQADRLQWSGAAIDRAQVASLLAATLRLPVEPELRFAPDPRASYDAAAGVVRAVRSSGVTRFGCVGNEQYRSFGKAG